MCSIVPTYTIGEKEAVFSVAIDKQYTYCINVCSKVQFKKWFYSKA